jgi:hypothetical protein
MSRKVQATPIFKLKNVYMLAMENIKTLLKYSLHMGRLRRCTRISWVVHACKTCRWFHPYISFVPKIKQDHIYCTYHLLYYVMISRLLTKIILVST